MASESMKLGLFGIELRWTMEDYSDATIQSDLTAGNATAEQQAKAEAIEALLLAHFKAGVDVMSDDYLEGLTVAVRAI